MSIFRQQLKDDETIIQSSPKSIPVQPHTHKYSHDAENLSGKSKCYIIILILRIYICVCVTLCVCM